jgi:hypothetical protein
MKNREFPVAVVDTRTQTRHRRVEIKVSELYERPGSRLLQCWTHPKDSIVDAPMSNADESMELWAYVLGEGDTAQRAALEARLRASVALQGRLEECRLLLGALGDPLMHDAPLATRTAARALMTNRAKLGESTGLSRVREILATLIHDSRVAASFAGFRGGGDRHFIFKAEGREIDLRLDGTNQSRRATGQVSPHNDGDTVRVIVEGSDSGAPKAEASTDAHGVFSLTLPPGPIRVRLECSDSIIRLPELQ